MTAGPVVVLVGPPGAGKTTVADAVAARWNVAVRDTDHDIERSAGVTVQEIFIDHGEQHFRALEEKAVAAALAEHQGVLSLGGGAILSETTRAALADHAVVFLDVGLAAAASRVGLGAGRPLLLGNVRSQLKSLMDARRPLYTAVATHVIVTDELDANGVADQVVDLIGASS
ncbi:shikimate kinase [Aeromicrobium sp. CF3.5]|uniref:shikimate kinase n=1 Tax=Aeromicrobium sp. CF3.5 TaxID=3373078 RepID=UPI003EE7F63C